MLCCFSPRKAKNQSNPFFPGTPSRGASLAAAQQFTFCASEKTLLSLQTCERLTEASALQQAASPLSAKPFGFVDSLKRRVETRRFLLFRCRPYRSATQYLTTAVFRSSGFPCMNREPHSFGKHILGRGKGVDLCAKNDTADGLAHGAALRSGRVGGSPGEREIPTALRHGAILPDKARCIGLCGNIRPAGGSGVMWKRLFCLPHPRRQFLYRGQHGSVCRRPDPL